MRIRESLLHPRWLTGFEPESQHPCITFRIESSGFESEYFSYGARHIPVMLTKSEMRWTEDARCVMIW